MDWELTGKIIWGICVIAWGVIRFRPNIKSRQTRIAITRRPLRERLSMILSQLGLGIIPVIWVFSGNPSRFDHAISAPVVLAGAAIFVASLILFRKTHKALGRMWSHSLDLREGHRLVTSGIYKQVRHPMYSAFWLWAAAQPFLLANWIAGLAGLVGFGALFFMRVGQEEKMMEDEFGQEYRDFCARTKRIIPGIY
ncbi:MAG: protein-S-isoprenylcysteine O-methyltransferase [Rhizobiaceae bacterium]